MVRSDKKSPRYQISAGVGGEVYETATVARNTTNYTRKVVTLH